MAQSSQSQSQGHNGQHTSGTHSSGDSHKSQGQDWSEGPVATAIEKQTAKLPSDLFLWAALGSIGLSLALQLMDKRDRSNFVGHWAPTFLALGLYNKLVKVAGHDQTKQA